MCLLSGMNDILNFWFCAWPKSLKCEQANESYWAFLFCYCLLCFTRWFYISSLWAKSLSVATDCMKPDLSAISWGFLYCFVQVDLNWAAVLSCCGVLSCCSNRFQLMTPRFPFLISKWKLLTITSLWYWLLCCISWF